MTGMGVLVEQEGREIAGVSRGQNAVYVMPHDWASMSQFLSPLVERIDEQTHAVQLLVLTPDSEVATAVTAAAVRLTEGRDVGILAATSTRRSARLVRLRPPHVIAGPADIILELVRAAAIKLDTVRMLCIAWADELMTQATPESLEALMTELPKDGARIVVTSELTPAVEALIERYARRGRRVGLPISEADQPTPVGYVTVSPQSRLSALRRLLDEVDPASALVFVRDSVSASEVGNLLRALGYSGSDAPIRVGLTATPGMDLVVLFDLPASREELRGAVGAAPRSIALIQPRQLASLRALAAGGTVSSFTLSESGTRVREREARMRAELRDALAQGQYGRELLALEPLLEEYDGIEIAAAALQLRDRDRATHAAAAQSAAPAPRERSTERSAERGNDRDSAGMVRLFVSVGSRDNVRPGDLVGAIANQGGVTSAEVGKIDVRESHSIVEVASSVADSVIERVTGVSIKGRRAVLRRDEERPPRSGPSRSSDRAGGARPRGARSDSTRESRPRSGPPRGRPRRGDGE